MKKEENPYKKFQESLKSLKGNLHVLDTSVPVEKQMDFFRFSEQIRDEFDENEIKSQIEILDDVYSTEDEIKYALSFLAISGDVKAFRAIEAYKDLPDPILKDWVSLAYLQAKITLESEFSEEKQVFISTGLGGKEEKLRFFAFFKVKDLQPLSDYQKELVEKEIRYSIHQAQGEVEELKVTDLYVTLVFLIDIRLDIKKILEDAIAESNQYGNFMSKSFIITNVRIFTKKNIQEELLKIDE